MVIKKMEQKCDKCDRVLDIDTDNYYVLYNGAIDEGNPMICQHCIDKIGGMR